MKSEQKISYAEEPDAWISVPCGRTLIWQIRVHPVCCGCCHINQMTRHTISQQTAALQALSSRPHQILTPLRPYTLPHWSPLSRHQPSPPSRRRSRSRDRRDRWSRPRSRPRSRRRLVLAGFCRHRRHFSSRLHHLFNVFLKVRHR